MEFTDYAEARKKIKAIKKRLATAKANLKKAESKKEPDEEVIKKRKATVLRFKTTLENAEKAAEKVRPGFFKRTSTWVAFGAVTTAAFITGTVIVVLRNNSAEDDDSATDSHGNGDTI